MDSLRAQELVLLGRVAVARDGVALLRLGDAAVLSVQPVQSAHVLLRKLLGLPDAFNPGVIPPPAHDYVDVHASAMLMKSSMWRSPLSV